MIYEFLKFYILFGFVYAGIHFIKNSDALNMALDAEGDLGKTKGLLIFLSMLLISLIWPFHASMNNNQQ